MRHFAAINPEAAHGIPEPVSGRGDSLICGIVGAVGGALRLPKIFREAWRVI